MCIHNDLYICFTSLTSKTLWYSFCWVNFLAGLDAGKSGVTGMQGVEKKEPVEITEEPVRFILVGVSECAD